MKKSIASLLFIGALILSFTGCKDDDSPAPLPKSSEKKIVSFQFAGLTPAVSGIIDETGKTVGIEVPFGTDVTALVPTIEVSALATVSPASGIAQNFTAPVSYTVTAEDGSSQSYTVTVTILPEEICLPTQLPGEEAYLMLTYNEDNTIHEIDYQNYDDPEPGRFISTFHYENGKVSVIDRFEDDEKYSYIEFEYSDATIIENIYFLNSVTEEYTLEQYFVHYIENDRIISTVLYDAFDNSTMIDSVVFTYDSEGNITQQDEYNSDNELEATWEIEYDDKENPYKLAGVNGGDGSFFDFENLSNNNYTRGTYTSHTGGGVSEDVVSYTYDSENRPLTRKFDWDDEMRSFSYECD